MSTVKKFRTLDYHTAGEPLRILLSGLPSLPGDTMLSRRRYMQEHHDDVRQLLMLEPRGHADMYGAVITEPVNPGSDCGVLFMHNEGYSTMCGHGIIALATAGLEHQLFTIRDRSDIRIDTPAGLVRASANMAGDHIESVSFLNVPSFVQETVRLNFEGHELEATIAFGGAWYAYIEASDLGLSLEPERAAELVQAGRAIKRRVSDHTRISHPRGDRDLDFLYGVIFVSQHDSPGHSRNVCIFADGELDRSPTGTGVSGRAAIHYANGEITLGEKLTVDSITGARFTVECVAETCEGDTPAVTTRVTGAAFMTGEHRFVLHAHDPMPRGFFIR